CREHAGSAPGLRILRRQGSHAQRLRAAWRRTSASTPDCCLLRRASPNWPRVLSHEIAHVDPAPHRAHGGQAGPGQPDRRMAALVVAHPGCALQCPDVARRRSGHRHGHPHRRPAQLHAASSSARPTASACRSLESSGYDVQRHGGLLRPACSSVGRLYENNAPAYLRTHPLTTERIADMENRAAARSQRQVPDSLGFQLVRAKLRSEQGMPADAITDFETQLREKKYASEVAARYGLAREGCGPRTVRPRNARLRRCGG
ncbi:MAG: hypothetical protein MZV65_48910, partial [Chromatiales bacterium]|nr:hypothetical protein [Chromatiales bacterium]